MIGRKELRMLALILGLVPAVGAPSATADLMVSDSQRSVPMEALPPAVERGLAQPVRLVVNRLRWEAHI
jgi:hypothetical protein